MLDIKYRFTCCDSGLSEITKKCQNIMTRIVVQMNIYQSNNYRKDLSWLHVDDEPGVQEKEQVMDQQSAISVYVVYLTIPSNI